jgi:hypothetical protein
MDLCEIVYTIFSVILLLAVIGGVVAGVLMILSE